MPKHVSTLVGVQPRVTVTRSQQERARRGGDAKVVVSFNSPADTMSAIVIVFIFTKLPRKLECLR